MHFCESAKAMDEDGSARPIIVECAQYAAIISDLDYVSCLAMKFWQKEIPN